MRGFFAFGVEANFSSELRKAMHSFPAYPGLKFLQPSEYHATVKFLSSFSSTDFFACLEDLCALGPPPAHSLIAGELALWPTVLALECEPSEELRAWHRQVNSLLERKGFIKERHPMFRPHITLARRKAGPAPGLEAQLVKLKGQFSGRLIPLEAPALWRSQAEETGLRHQPLLSILFRL